MSEGSGQHETEGGGTRSPERPAAERQPSGAPERRPRTALWLGTAGVAGLAAVLILAQFGVFDTHKPSGGFRPTTTRPALAARQTAQAFLAAWRRGSIQQAANYTNHPAAAAAALTSYRNGLHLHALKLTVHDATAQGKVAFSVAASVGLPSTSGRAGQAGSSGTAGHSGTSAATATWSYQSDLTTYSRSGDWFVRWDPALVAPNLTAGEKVVTSPVGPGAAKVTDAAGNNLQGDVGLTNIAAALMKSAPGDRGTPGVAVAYLTSAGTPVDGTPKVLSQPAPSGVVKTTIDPKVEAAAKSAVQAHAGSTMVVIQPTTGHILAVANNDGNNDFALTARVAPGSTNKIITTTALFTTGLLKSPSQSVDCPSQIDVDGEVIHNAGGESEPPGSSFLTDFAASCNNAFDRWYSSLSPTALAQTAEKYYGLNHPWDIGLGSGVPYYTLPPSASSNELALELFGQGRLSAAPLAMASVAATVDAGTFRQPIVVAGVPQPTGTPLAGNVHRYMWQLMRAVTQSGGTAAGVFDSVGSAVYAKTGTADVSGQGQPNSWLVAFDPTLNVAIGCLVLNAGYGAQVAGPEVATALQQLSH